MKNYQRLKGLIAASFTPMDAQGKINLSAINKYADLMAKSDLTGVFVCGTTGESQSLTTNERKNILEQWIKSSNGRFKVIAHIGSNSQVEAVELARHAAEIGADAIAAMAPCFFKPETVKDLINFFTPIANSAEELPFYYYNMPSMTGVFLPVATFLSEGKKVMPNLVGTKFTHNNLMEMGECLALNNGEFEVLHGYDEILISGLAFGAVAGVGSTYNYLPEVYHGILKAVKEGDFEHARKLQMKSIEIVKIIIKYGGGVRGGKAIMNLIGIDCGPCRLPIPAVSKEEYDMLNMYGDASKVIRESDVVIAVMGINQSIEREGQDRSSIELPKDQQIFIREAYKANPNTIVVLVAGSSMAIGWMDQNIPAIIDAWYPGEQGGTAIAEVLFGDYNPAGRLPLTFYNSIEDLPAFNDYNVKNNRTYMYFEGKPLYAFGYGLSYTKFDYRNLNIKQDSQNITLNFSVKNSGKYNGDEVAQVYIQFPDLGIKTPLKQLKGFKRIHIKKGATEQISIEIPKEELRLWDDQKKQFYTPSGTYNFMVGKSSDNICLQKTVEL